VTWGFEKAKGKRPSKSFPLTSHHRSESPAKQPIKIIITRNVPARNKATRNYICKVTCWLVLHIIGLSQIKQLTNIIDEAINDV
jgi:hypothetical protein